MNRRRPGLRSQGRLLLAAAVAILSAVPSLAAVYFVNSEAGDDDRSGRTPQHAWRTLARLESAGLSAGDVVRLSRGGRWREQLHLRVSGTGGAPVIIEDYGDSEAPAIISGADIVGPGKLVAPAAKRYATACETRPGQIYMDGVRGNRRDSVEDVKQAGEWCHARGVLYYSDAGGTATVEVSTRAHAIEMNGDHLIVRRVQVERTSGAAIQVHKTSSDVTIEEVTILQWDAATDPRVGGVTNLGRSTTIKQCIFGRMTGDDLCDQNWAGFVAIVSTGADARILGNQVFHNSIENESAMGRMANGISVFAGSTGVTEIAGNHVYHVAGNAIGVNGTRSVAGDRLLVHHNRIRCSGQAGISAYKTRVVAGAYGSAEGQVHDNLVTYANRLGGAVGGGYIDASRQGNRAGGIHFNDGAEQGTDPTAPYLRWSCYDNEVSHSVSPQERASPDSDGIAIDYNANAVRVYRNRIHDCDGKGIYIWNADRCIVAYNVVYRNDVGVLVTSSGPDSKTGRESADDNLVCHNTFYKNSNGVGIGKDYHAEIYFGMRGRRNTFVNNIVYVAGGGLTGNLAYYFDPKEAEDCLVDCNLVYSEAGPEASVCGEKGLSLSGSFSQWRSDHPAWDQHSIFADPKFVDAGVDDFRLADSSPAIDQGIDLQNRCNLAVPVVGRPDLGAFEKGGCPPRTP